jgi:hypothetical protein
LASRCHRKVCYFWEFINKILTFQIWFFFSDKNFAWSKLGAFDEIENRGIYAGVENGHKVYIARTVDKQGNFFPAKVIPALSSSIYMSNGIEESASDLDVLENSSGFDWVKCDGKFDKKFTSLFSDSYVGRGSHNGKVVIGKVDMKKKALIVLSNGAQISLACEEILVQKSKLKLKVSVFQHVSRKNLK